MKPLIHSIAIVATVASGCFSAYAAPGTMTNAVPIRSVFILPSNLNEGKDPFFPESARVYEVVAAEKHPVHAPDVVMALTVKGISGTGADRKAIVNNHTFGVGDTGDVLLPGGGRLHLKCLEITDDSVTIEAAGQRRELKFTPKP